MLGKTALLIASLAAILPKAADDSFPLPGSGTLEDPYTISTVEEMNEFSALVNDGKTFEDEYVTLEANLDFENTAFTPIGVFDGENFFKGTFNGHGHYVENIVIEGGNAAIFGMLMGTVINFGIESGYLSGACIGSIASHSAGDPYIINCYSKATLSGARAGGLVDNYNGRIINCWESATLNEGTYAGGLFSWGANLVYNSYTTNQMPEGTEDSVEAGGGVIDLETLNSEETVKKLNDQRTYWAAFSGKNLPLNKWTLNDGLLGFASTSSTAKADTTFYFFNHFYFLWPCGVMGLAFILIPVGVFIADWVKNKKKEAKEQDKQ